MSVVVADRGIAQEEIVDLARALARRELVPHALELDERRPGALEEAWGHVVEVGFDRAVLPVENGGVGLDSGLLLPCLEELAVGDAGVALLVLLANAALAALPPEVVAEVGASQRWALVPTPPQGLGTSARLMDQCWIAERPAITGTLSPALGAFGADGIVVVQRGPEPRAMAMPADALGLAVEACDHQLGLRSAVAARISLTNTPAEFPPGPDGSQTAGASLSLLRAGSAAIARGVARRAQEMAVEYAQQRVQGGKAIVEHDAVRRMLAAMTLGIAATPASTGAGLDDAAALTAKVTCSEAALAAAGDAVQVFGGTGYMHETGVEKLMRDAKYLQLWPEPNWMADEEIVAHALNGGPAALAQ